MSKQKWTEPEIDALDKDLMNIISIVETGYPYYNIPTQLRQVLKCIRVLRSRIPDNAKLHS